MANVACVPIPTPNHLPSAIKSIANAAITSLRNIGHKRENGVLVTGQTKHDIALEVSVPRDWNNLVKRVLYAGWSLICGARLVSDGLPKIKIEWLSNFTWFQDTASAVGQAAAVAVGTANAFALFEGGLASFDLYKAICRLWKVNAKLTPENLRAHDLAKAKWEASREARKIRKAEDEAARQAVLKRASQDSDIPDAENRLSGEAYSANGGAGNEADPQYDSLPATVPEPMAPTMDECAKYLMVADAKCEKDKAKAGLLNDGIAWGRDFVAQGFRASWDVAFNIGKFCAAHLAAGVSFGATALMGVGHAVAGFYERHQAKRLIASTERAINAADHARDTLVGDKKLGRMQSDYAVETFAQIQNGRREHKSFAERLNTWAKVRIGYGAFSLALTGASIAATVLLAGTIFASGGIVLLPIALTAGSIWLAFAYRKTAVRNERNERVLREKMMVESAVAKALSETDRHATKEEKKDSQGVVNCPVEILERLAKEHHALKDNRYLAAAILTKRLLSKQASSATSGSDYIDPKAERLEASAVLQVLGMSKTLTSMLKRAPFDHSVKIVHDYILGEVGIHAHAQDGAKT